jgi:hypothetical protein
MQKMNFMLPIIKLEEKLMSRVAVQYQPLMAQTGAVMDIWGVAIKKDHMGKRLLHKMMRFNENFGAAKGFQYSFSYASNFKTEVALGKQNYEKIASFDSTLFEIEGVQYF